MKEGVNRVGNDWWGKIIGYDHVCGLECCEEDVWVGRVYLRCILSGYKGELQTFSAEVDFRYL